MKKFIFICLFALLLTPNVSSAQTQEDVNKQLLTVINQLMVQVQDLMAKLLEIQSKQVEDSQKITSMIPSSVAQSSAPVFGASQVVVRQAGVTLGTPYCSTSSKGWATIPVNVSGISWNYAMADSSDGYTIRKTGFSPKHPYFDSNLVGTSTFKLLFTTTHQSSPWATNEHEFDSPTYQGNFEVVLPNCQ